MRKVLQQFPSKELASQPLPRLDRTDDRYELLNKFQLILQRLGFRGVIVLMDRVDEPHMTGGKPELMQRFVWPLLDNKLLKHPGIGFKIMLPQELHREIERETREFHERARLDNEFFGPRWANALMSMLNSVALCFPQSVFREHHFNHHRYNNQAPADGQEGDLSSLQRFSRVPGQPEALWRYALLSPLRADVLRYARAAFTAGRGRQVVLDSVAVVSVMAALAWWMPAYFVVYYLPLLYFGHVVTYTEGYFEHHRAVPGDRQRNAVSCYSRWYNFIWFNNGYHQEHHCYPGVHWTRIAAMRERMLPEPERRVVPHAHWVNF